MNPETYILSTSRIVLRVWSDSDAYLARQLWGNPIVSKFITASGSFTEEEIQSRLRKEIENSNLFGIQYWPLFLKDSGEFIGCCGLRPYRMEEKIVEFGCHLLPRYWGQGFASEAAEIVFDYAFNKRRFDAIFAGHNPNNAISKGLLTKLGFVFTNMEYYEPTGLMHPSYLLSRCAYHDKYDL